MDSSDLVFFIDIKPSSLALWLGDLVVLSSNLICNSAQVNQKANKLLLESSFLFMY